MLRRRHVAPAIIERVLRLNPNHEPGERLRGIHYKRDPRWQSDWWSRGDVIRRFGREAIARLPAWAVRKDGKRVYYTREAVEDYL
jgi:hypothetical protein